MKNFFTAIFLLSDFLDISDSLISELVEYVSYIIDSISGLLNLFHSLPDVIFVFFPFLSAIQVEYLTNLLCVMFIIGCVFLLKRFL